MRGYMQAKMLLARRRPLLQSKPWQAATRRHDVESAASAGADPDAPFNVHSREA
jgi:hypothetical protein